MGWFFSSVISKLHLVMLVTVFMKEKATEMSMWTSK